MQQALVFTRTKHRANRLADHLVKRRHPNAERSTATGRRRSARTALEGFKSGRYPRAGRDRHRGARDRRRALGHVVNFDVPLVPEDYIHRVGRTGRAEATGDAFTFVSPEEEGNLRDIERAISRRLPRVTVPDFDYTRSRRRLEVPLAEPDRRDPGAEAGRTCPCRCQCGTTVGKPARPGAAGGAASARSSPSRRAPRTTRPSLALWRTPSRTRRIRRPFASLMS